MSIDWLSFAALATVIALFAVIFILRKKKVNFTLLILGTLVAGVVVGIIFSGHTSYITPIGKIYVSVLNAMVIPIISISIISSVTSLSGVAQLKGIGLKSILWLLTTTLIAIVLTIGLGLTFGVGKDSYLSIEGVDASSFTNKVTSFSEVVVNFFPRNIISDMADENTIPVILFVLLISVSYVLVANKNPEKVKPFKDFVEAAKEVIFKALSIVVRLTPYAVLSLIATSIGNGVNKKGMLWSLVVLLIVSFIAFVIDTWVINGALISLFTNLNPIYFFRKIFPAQVIAFSTQSSAGTLPVSLDILKNKIGVDEKVADVTTPLGTTIGMPGCAGIWPVIIAIYGINGLGINFSASQYVLLVVVSLFISLGTAGVPGTATVTTASLLTILGLPLELIVLTLPISSIADTGRTATNATAAIVSATLVAASEDEIHEVEDKEWRKEYAKI
ncbi:dicarboxylate/amino acid:cation symporter [Eubacterium xylanophilum]|uniref:dicarboxylate/amino acid:cation symporter n=1 Tax=Eubacterium xylanophilum TaxID=39497 RepID=UPI00047B1EC1|nr:dicarboxylate/amino acid:cation symporter [Eubacterium xylanophilum]